MIRGAFKSEGLRIWLITAMAFIVASVCLVSLTWDGSCYLFWTAENGRPVVPHGRIINLFLLGPVAATRNLTDSPILLAQLYGLMCSILPLASLGLCLAMLRGNYRNLRIWMIAGILLVPLPGQMALSAEAVPVLQVAWVLISFSLIGCPWRWSPIAAVATAIQFIIHPVSAPLFGVTAIVCFIAGWRSTKDVRNRSLVWAVIFLLTAGAKTWHTLATASSYERAHLSAMAFISEMGSGLLASPFPAIVPLCIAFWSEHKFRQGSRSQIDHVRITARCWKASIVLSVICILCPILWSGGLNYRKFGMFLAAPLAILAAFDANRTVRKTSFILSPTRLAAFFAASFILTSITWLGLCFYTHQQAQKSATAVITKAEFPFVLRYSALNHWSNTPLLFVLEGRAPQHVLLGQEAQSTENAAVLFPNYEIPYADGWFHLGHFKR